MRGVYQSYVRVERMTASDEDGVTEFTWRRITGGWCRVDLLHLHDPGIPVVVRESAISPERLGTVFLGPEVLKGSRVVPEDVIVVEKGPYKGVRLKVEVTPTAAYLGGGTVLHYECKVREVNPMVAA